MQTSSENPCSTFDFLSHKPAELQNLDIYPHLKHNIVNTLQNCQDPLTENSYYCFNCKLSTCPKCNLNSHKDHFLIPRYPCLNFSNSFFNNIENKIISAINIKNLKNEFIVKIEKLFNNIITKCNEIKTIKINEINTIFDFINKNVNELETNFNIAKEKMITYFNNNNNFFNLSSENTDTENTIFLMNFELINLCDNKNKKVITCIQNLKENLEKEMNTLHSNSHQVLNSFNIFINKEQKKSFELRNQFDDFYWDVITRINVYNEHIISTRKSMFNTLCKTGSFQNLDNLITVLDSKNKKGIKYIFNQNCSNSKNNSPISSKQKVVNESESNSEIINGNSSFRKTPRNIKTKKRSQFGVMTPDKNNSNIHTLDSKGRNMTKIDKLKRCKSNPMMQCNIQQSPNGKQNCKNKNNLITLDSRTKQRFFSYAVLDIYNKYFSMRKDINTSDSNQKIFSSSKRRNFLLKELAKPIIGSSDILIYDQTTNRSKKIRTTLNKTDHGYSTFPNGVRHILINNNYLYITGGTDQDNKPISTALLYNLQLKTLIQLPNMCFVHSYHSMEYLENYDCFIVIGGEINPFCEIYDLYTKKWSRLPELGCPRANVSIYFDKNTSDVYALFGLEGKISKKRNYSNLIEVIELNDISCGWIKVDYYKRAMIDLKENYVEVYPFTKDKLLLRGIKAKNHKYINAFYDLYKNEIVNVSDKVAEQLRIEDNQFKISEKK